MGSGKNRKGQRKKEEDSNVNAIPESSREIVQSMKEVVNCCEQDIYAMLLECSMDADEAITRLLSQVSMTEALLNDPISEPQMDQQAMDHQYSQPMVPSGNNGDMMNYTYSQPTQNDTYNVSPSAFQKHGGRNNNSYHLRFLTAPLPQDSNSALSLSAVAVPSAHSSAYGSTNGSTCGFGMSNDTTANSMCGYEDVLSSEFSNHLATLQYQDGSSNMWTYQGPQEQQSQSFRHSQQQQEQEQEQPYRRTDYENESSRYYASPDQGNK